MTLNLTVPDKNDLRPRITVFGVGGAGGNAVNNMIEKELDGVEFVVANTDAQALAQSKAPSRVQIGVKVTEGLGAGARPSVGAAAAEESIEEIVDHLAGAHMCFITAGMGGGTGTGAAPIIAQAARELGVLTVGVVTKPFQFEGAKRMRQAEEGVETLQRMVDTLIIIPNQNLFRLANEKTTFTEAFSLADDVLYQGVKGVTDLMVRPGLINLDFADVRAVMDEMGKAMMGTGEGQGENRAVDAAEKAIANPLLDEISLKGAKGVLINITGGHDLTLFELDEAANRIREEVDPDANIIVGSTLDAEMEGRMRVSVVATGIDAQIGEREVPRPRRSMAEPLHAEVQEQPAAEPEPERAVARSAPEFEDEASEPSLFEAQERGGQAEAGLFHDDEDDLPQPAYRSEPEPRDSERAARSERQPRPDYESRYDDRVPDRQGERPSERPVRAEPPRRPAEPPRRSAGTPSEDTMKRLQAAVRKRPAEDEPPRRSSEPVRRGAEAERPKFGINGLIGRMTGHPHEAERSPAAVRRQPPVQAEPDLPARAVEDERIEIPAFLRRQAN